MGGRLRKILKRMGLIVLGLLALWIIAVQAGCLSMRTSDRSWKTKLAKAGQTIEPIFLDVADANDRLVHTIAIQRADTLPWVIMVHGSPGSADAFLSYLGDTLLTQFANVAAIDRPGFGYTSGFGKPEPSQMAQALALRAVVERLSPGRPVVLVGHSLGGPVVACFAMEYPELTEALVMAGASIDPELEEHPWWQKAVDVPPLKWLTPKALWTSNAEIIPLEKELEIMLPGWERITCPVRMVHAENDRLVPFANVAFARRMLTNSRDFQAVTFAKGDHFFVWTNPAILREVVLGVLEK